MENRMSMRGVAVLTPQMKAIESKEGLKEKLFKAGIVLIEVHPAELGIKTTGV